MSCGSMTSGSLVSRYPVKSSPRISTRAARSFSIQRTRVEWETSRSRASFSPETAMVMFCIRANSNSSSFLSMVSAGSDAKMYIGRLYGMCQSANGYAIDTGDGKVPDVLQSNPSRRFQRNPAATLDYRMAGLIRREIVEQDHIRLRMNGLFELIEINNLYFKGRCLTKVLPSFGN